MTVFVVFAIRRKFISKVKRVFIYNVIDTKKLDVFKENEFSSGRETTRSAPSFNLRAR